MQGRLAIFLTAAVVLVVLVALNAATYVRVERESDQEFRPDRSTLNAGATGTRALHDFLTRSGFRVARWNKPPSALLGGVASDERPETFVVVGQLRRPYRREEAEALARWVGEGGRLVVIDRTPDDLLLPPSGGWRVSHEPFDFPDMETRPDDPESMTAGVRPVAPAQPTRLTRDVEQVMPSRFASRLSILRATRGDADTGDASGSNDTPDTGDTSDAGDTSASDAASQTGAASGTGAAEDDDAWAERDVDEPPPPPAPTGATRPPVVVGESDAESASPSSESESASSPSDAAEAARAPVRHFLDARPGGASGSLLVDYSYGRGRVVVLSDPYVVANGGINRADNLQLAVNVVAGTRGGLIAFDEYHQGHGAGGGASGGALALFAGTPVLWMFAQGGLVALALLWSRGRRFARALPAPHVDRRSKLEFVASMAELQQRARAHDLAVENVYGRTRRALARYGGLGPDAPHEEIAARVAGRSGRDRNQLATLLAHCEAAVAGERLPARKALALVKALRELERDLGIRMRAREIRQRGQGRR